MLKLNLEGNVLALAHQPDGSGILEPLAEFTTNPAGSAIVNSLGSSKAKRMCSAAI
jgi:hypothetical protein